MMTLKLSEVENIVVISEFSDIKVELVKRSADFDVKDGSVVINKVARDFSEILLVGQGANFQLKVEEKSNYKMIANARFASVNFPKISKVVCQDNKGGEQKVEVHVGEKMNPYSYIKARVKYGDISVK